MRTATNVICAFHMFNKKCRERQSTSVDETPGSKAHPKRRAENVQISRYKLSISEVANKFSSDSFWVPLWSSNFSMLRSIGYWGVESSHCHPCHAKVCICIVVRKVRSVTMEDVCPSPLIEGSRIPKARFITSLFLKDPCWQIPERLIY